MTTRDHCIYVGSSLAKGCLTPYSDHFLAVPEVTSFRGPVGNYNRDAFGAFTEPPGAYKGPQLRPS